MDLLRFFRRSLGLKVMFLTSALILTAFIGLFVYNSFWEYDMIVDDVHQTAAKTSDLLQLGIEKPMARGDNQGTMDQFAALGSRYDDIRVHMYDYRGEIAYSTNADVVRQSIFDVENHDGLAALVRKSLDMDTEEGKLIKMHGERLFVQINTVQNAPECHHCHGRSRQILGGMVVAQNVDAQFANLRKNQVRAAGISLLGGIGLITILLLFIKYGVVRKIQDIALATEQVSQGNLDAEFHVSGHDELGRLGNDLSEMVQQIKDQLQYNRSVLSGIIVPMFVTDRDTRLEYVNEPLRAILGKEDSEILGRTVSDIFYGNEQAATTPEVIESGQSASGNLRFKRGDGVEFPLHFEVSPLRDANEQVVGALGVLIDLTQEERDRRDIEQQQAALLQVANEVTGTAMSLKKASDELLGQMDNLTTGVDSTADQTGRVATAMEEMNSTVLEVARNASETAEAAERANKVAQDGGGVVQNTVQEINGVAHTTQETAETLQELTQRAQNIGQVMAVINDIADQTNLLALNAAIEAARAGDAGRGFAVVADEVRKLAEKTMHATKEVEDAVALIQESTADVVKEMGNNQGRVVRTSEMAEEAGQVLGEVVSQSDLIADMVRNIATAAEEQSATSDEINNNVNEISNLSQSVSTGIQEANARISEVADMATQLTEMVAAFRK
ncbi:methyl-accepting chemotaxis sensory transducer with Pas/Pac sensor [Paucidesulfovibrio gracilis DSM 16080]|uniref:Methyl-accepting chemotaxis sensory transducer with Pas/Pac sensor n=1 Tax=Paucidesulfovibrio gracilis DSM 16080 TaxID=1121449 RepID=A0A1T4X3D7_9BACT|nr:methyl-accepting chemotaxis protein [Paucidesulfovibrio gracilis]SKA83575.1 methyl-accepting chemotaxis sensory transducer with Pas/Pac sensor [Paucidesulfovibrio gracilis DSM 16080]